MRCTVLAALIATTLPLTAAKPARAYDMDCAIMLCMAGGFPSSAVCAAAYAEMIRRITPWPVRPPFGICTFAAVPVDLGGPGGEGVLDISTPDYAWLRRTRVLWFFGRSYAPKDDPLQWDWTVRSCDHENSHCRTMISVSGSPTPWPATFVSENGQILNYPGGGSYTYFYRRAVMVEFGDYEGTMGHSDWFAY